MNRSQDVVEEIKRLHLRGDLDAMVRTLRLRIAELDTEIARVQDSSDYSISDKQKMLKVLENERDGWYNALAAGGF